MADVMLLPSFSKSPLLHSTTVYSVYTVQYSTVMPYSHHPTDSNDHDAVQFDPLNHDMTPIIRHARALLCAAAANDII